MKTRTLIGLFLISFLVLSCNVPSLGAGKETQPVETAAVTETEEASAEETQAAAEASDVLEPTLQLDKTEFTPGEQIQVRFTAPSTLSTDAWIGIVPSGTPHGSEAENDEVDVAYEYLDGRVEGVVMLPAPEEPGQYDVRMFDTDNEGQELISVSLTVAGEAVSMNQISCQGLTITLPDELATGITCETVPATTGATDLPPWEIRPEYTNAKLDNYLLQNTFHSPQIYVFPVEGYEQASEQAGLIIADLRALLDEEPSDPESIPVLPAFNAAQMIRTQIEYIPFQNGRGVRFLTMYGQAAYPVNNEDLIYVYQGLTDDGTKYISVILPVNHPDLQPTGANVPNGDWAAFNENFETYIAEMTLQINQYESNSFNPTLTVLDGLVESLQVE